MIGPQPAAWGRELPPARALRVTLRRVLAHAWIWSAGSQALTSGMSLLVSIGAARILGIDAFGQYVLILTGVIVVSTLQYHLVPGPMMVLSGQRNRSAPYYGAVARAMILVAVLAALVVAAYVLALLGRDPSPRLDLALGGSLAVAGSILQDGAKRILFARGGPRLAFLCEAARHALFVLALAAAWPLVGVSATVLLVCAGLAYLLAALPVLLPLLRLPPRGDLHRVVAGRHWRLGRWLTLVVLVSMAHEQFATIAAGIWIGHDAAAGLRAANLLLGPLLVLLSSLENVVPRSAAERLRVGGRPALAAYLRRVLLLTEVPILAVCAAVVLFGETLLRLLLGSGFGVFAPVAAIMAIAPPIVAAREMGVIYLRTIGSTHSVFTAFAVSAAVTLLALYPLIRTWGVVGAALAIVLGHAVTAALVLVRVRRG